MQSIDRPPRGVQTSRPDDPVALFAQLIEARRARDTKRSLDLRRALLKTGWSISPVEPGRGAR